MRALDPRIERGTRAMLALRAERLAAGERPLGWKVGFGAPAALDRFGIDRPLVGFLTDRGLVVDGAAVPIGAWTTPMLEPEIAIYLAADVAGTATAAEVRAAIESAAWCFAPGWKPGWKRCARRSAVPSGRASSPWSGSTRLTWEGTGCRT